METSRYSLKRTERSTPCHGSASIAVPTPLAHTFASPPSQWRRNPPHQNLLFLHGKTAPYPKAVLGYWLSLWEGFFFAFRENVAWTISPLPGKLSPLIYQGIIIPSLYSFAQAFMKTGRQFKVHLIYTLSKRKSLSQENYVSLRVSKYSISIAEKWQAVSAQRELQPRWD